MHQGVHQTLGLREGWGGGGMTQGGRQQGSAILVQEKLHPDSYHGNRGRGAREGMNAYVLTFYLE